MQARVSDTLAWQVTANQSMFQREMLTGVCAMALQRSAKLQCESPVRNCKNILGRLR